MLHAISQNKTNLHKRYLGHREKSERRVSEEDELTSLIMSPLSLLSKSAIGTFWKALIEWNEVDTLPIKLPDKPVENAMIEFWPRRYTEKEVLEPDMLVKLEWPSGAHINLLVEFKWRAPLSGERQLHNQWEKFLSDEERQNSYHIYIAPELSNGYKALDHKDVWNGKLLLRSWFDILNILTQKPYSIQTNELLTWSDHVCNLLEKLHIRPFNGFQQVITRENLNQSFNIISFFQVMKNKNILEYQTLQPTGIPFFFQNNR